MSDLEIDNNNQTSVNGNWQRSKSARMNSDPGLNVPDTRSARNLDSKCARNLDPRDERESSQDSLEIIDLDSLESVKLDDETWLVSSPNRNIPEANKSIDDWMAGDLDSGELAPKSLVNKLEIISKSSPTRFSSSSSSSYGMPSPGVTAYLTHHNLASTPLQKPAGASRSNFDSRTFSRSSGNRALLNRTFGYGDDSDGILTSSPIKFSQTSFYKISSPHLINSTFDRDISPGPPPGLRLNETFDQKSYFRLAASPRFNSTFDKEPLPGYGNATFLKDSSPPNVGPFNSTFRKDDLIASGNNTTFRKDDANATFEVRGANNTFDIRTSGINNTFEIRTPAANNTFEIRPTGEARKLSEDRLSSTSSSDHFATHRLSRDSSHDMLDEDRLSTTSESSASHRLNDVGDVQHIARMQEESLRQPIIPSSHRSATISPSSEHSANSPSTEGYMTGNNMGYQSEEGGMDKGAMGGNGGGSHQYSSQDSLPDSPYSSQSLDVQPLSEQDRLRRSMPNLNKIRGHSARGGGMGGGSGLPRGGGAPQRPTYGALSRQHASDPRLQAGSSRLRFQAPPPARGTTVTTSTEYSLAPPRYGSTSAMQPPRQYAYSGGPQQPNPPSQTGWGQTMLPQPKATGIPRPGSRIPGPRTTSGIPKPGGYSQPGSRASSIGPRKIVAAIPGKTGAKK